MIRRHIKWWIVAIVGVFIVGFTPAETALANTEGTPIDVYFVTGQSNARRFGTTAATGSTDKDYTLHFARSDTNSGVDHIDQEFTDNLLTDGQGVTVLADELVDNETGQIGIYNFGVPGSSLALDDNRSSWYPGDDPENGDYWNNDLYVGFYNWVNTRLEELRSDGFEPEVKGIFWYQGEADAILGTPQADHERNLENLIYRMRRDFGDIPFVMTELNEIAANGSGTEVINDAMQSVADNDSMVELINTEGLNYGDNVHLNFDQYGEVAERWADAFDTANGSE